MAYKTTRLKPNTLNIVNSNFSAIPAGPLFPFYGRPSLGYQIPVPAWTRGAECVGWHRNPKPSLLTATCT